MIDIKKCKKFLKKELAIGKKIEMEHTNSKMRATKIAKQHLCEYPKYYSELVKMEKKFSNA